VLGRIVDGIFHDGNILIDAAEKKPSSIALQRMRAQTSIARQRAAPVACALSQCAHRARWLTALVNPSGRAQASMTLLSPMTFPFFKKMA
jgi:hypothetical protein